MSGADGEQTLICEGCGSRWRKTIAKGRSEVTAFLQECPLCEGKELASVKDKALRVLYRRFDDGGLIVWVYRGIKLLTVIEIFADNRIQLFK